VIEPSPRTAVVVVALILIGVVFVAASTQHRPGPRLSRKARLVDLIRAEDARARSLRAQLDDLRTQVDALSAGDSARARRLAELRRVADGLAPYAGLAAVRGPGIVVELRDSSLQRAPGGDPNDLVIHEQDLQSVVNALWASGAEAIGINGERITGESAIRCVGNTLLLHGSVYSPPYRIAAIGNATALRNGLDDDPYVERFRDAAREFRLGFDVADETALALPGFSGVVAERYAEAA
jgi:uncharacterized protein YlxW (UPF0749 family)